MIRWFNHIHLLLAQMAGLMIAGLMALCAGPAHASMAGEAALQRIDGRLQRVVDGDTVRVTAIIWVDQVVDVSVRLDGVDAPEIFRPKCAGEKALGLQARDFVSTFLDGETVILRAVRKGKFAGRVVARVERDDGADLGDALIEAGLAVPYGGRGPRNDWCASPLAGHAGKKG